MDADLGLVREFYPNAVTSDQATELLLGIVYEQLKLTPGKIMHANSICSDDINELEFPERAYDMLGPFRMGGLDGFPFTGITGMKAYAGHVPEGGALLLFCGPHIGLTNTGELGRVKRVGQSGYTNCCGAAAAALDKLQRGEISEGDITVLDYQQNVLEQILLREKEKILRSEYPIKQATEVIYEAIEERIRTLLDAVRFSCRYVILSGGVVINGGDGTTSYCSFRLLECVDVQTGGRMDLYRHLNVGSVSKRVRLLLYRRIFKRNSLGR